MLKTSSLQNLRKFFTKNYHGYVRTRGESAMDTLLGTMIGVLFLAVITASFAGIYMAYTVSTAKAKENTERANLSSSLSAAALNGLYVDSSSGRSIATSAGWSVTAQGTTPLSSAAPGTNAAYAKYTYAAKAPMKPNSPVTVSQWGVLETSGTDRGLVKIYTAIPKAGQTVACDWTQTPAALSTSCVVVYDVLSSIVAPPLAYNIYPDVNWEKSVRVAPWTTTPNFYGAEWNSFTTSKIGTTDVTSMKSNPDGSRTVRFVALLKDLDPNKKVSIDFRKPGEESFFGYTFTPTAKTGETGKLERAVYGVFVAPPNTTLVDVYVDTYVTDPQQSTDPTIQGSRFFVYQAIPDA